LKGEYILTYDELEQCKSLFQKGGMKFFEDWLKHYNNLDVGPGLEAFEKM